MINLMNIDCIEHMQKIPDQYYDLAIVDPPYGTGDIRQNRSRRIHDKFTWNNEIPTEQYFNELYRISKNRIIWGANYFRAHIKDVGVIVHDKTGGGKRKQLKELSDCDIASHSFGNNMKIYHYLWMGNVQGSKIDWDNSNRWHPMQKPVQLYKWILLNYAKKGNKIFDSHLGSGTIAHACSDLGYELDACETDPIYYNKACEKLKEHRQQIKLWAINTYTEQ